VYGPIGYDTVPPVTKISLAGNLVSGTYDSQVTVTLSATDASSGVAHTYYAVGGGSYVSYAGPFTVDTAGAHKVNYYSVDVAGNTETAHAKKFTIGDVLSIGLSASSLTYPTTVIGKKSAAQVITVTNTGTESITFTSVTIGGADPSSYILSSNSCTGAVAPGKTCKVGVEFKPAAAGALTATLSIKDNVSGSPQKVALKGKGET
jgi:hypothetical protein